VSRHVVFDEAVFPFSQAADRPTDPAPVLDFLLELTATQLPAMHAPRQPAMHGARLPTPPTRPTAGSAPSTPGPPSPGLRTPLGTPHASLTPAAASPQVLIHRPPSPSNRHDMVTHAKQGIFQPIDRLNLSTSYSTVPPIPKTYRGALHDPHWQHAMHDEFDAHVTNGTWSLVPRPSRANVVLGKWIFKHKFHSDGSLACYKARWVVRGFSQLPGIDFDETFTPS
jgi:hypothetical protein